jgi:hypothetical protein
MSPKIVKEFAALSAGKDKLNLKKIFFLKYIYNKNKKV